jgi:hypothetical protein
LWITTFGGTNTDEQPDGLAKVFGSASRSIQRAFGYANPRFDTLVAKQRAALDRAERSRPAAEMQQIAARDLPMLPVVYPPPTTVVRIRDFYVWALLLGPRLRTSPAPGSFDLVLCAAVTSMHGPTAARSTNWTTLRRPCSRPSMTSRKGVAAVTADSDVKAEPVVSTASGPRVLVGATGSIAVTELPAYLEALRARIGGSYSVLMTHTATAFIPPHVLRLSAERVIDSENPADWPANRPSRLAAGHDLTLVLPATAHILAAAATGAAPNRLATVLLAVNHPVVFFPHMGAAMWGKPAVRRNVATIRADGNHVVDPVPHRSHDIVTGTAVQHPGLPSVVSVADFVADLLPTLAARTSTS